MEVYLFTFRPMILFITDFAISFFFIPGLGKFSKSCLVETITSSSVIVADSIKSTTKTSSTVNVIIRNFNPDSQSSVPVNTDFVINNYFKIVVCINHPNSCTNFSFESVRSNDNWVRVCGFQLNWLFKNVCPDFDEIHADLGSWNLNTQHLSHWLMKTES